MHRIGQRSMANYGVHVVCKASIANTAANLLQNAIVERTCPIEKVLGQFQASRWNSFTLLVGLVGSLLGGVNCVRTLCRSHTFLHL